MKKNSSVCYLMLGVREMHPSKFSSLKKDNDQSGHLRYFKTRINEAMSVILLYRCNDIAVLKQILLNGLWQIYFCSSKYVIISV